MIHRHLFCLAVSTALAFGGGLARASGSEGGGSAETGDTAAYNTGKGVYTTKFACSSCPMAGKNLDASLARSLLTDKRGVSLSAAEASALDTYLKRRFKL